MIRYSRAFILSVALIAGASAAQAQSATGGSGERGRGGLLARQSLDFPTSADHLDIYQHRSLSVRIGQRRARKAVRVAAPPLPVRRDQALQPPLPVRGNAMRERATAGEGLRVDARPVPAHGKAA